MTGVRVMPACPPVPWLYRERVHANPSKLERTVSVCHHLAYCHAQALAARDGKRRQVRKVGGLWQVSEA